jgi:hypothetical protein
MPCIGARTNYSNPPFLPRFLQNKTENPAKTALNNNKINEISRKRL